jgi:hypothetical protein
MHGLERLELGQSRKSSLSRIALGLLLRLELLLFPKADPTPQSPVELSRLKDVSKFKHVDEFTTM